MRLTPLEFQSLIRIQWVEKVTDDGRMYYTPADEVSTQLFNLDLMKKILSKQFKNQNAITTLPNYDISQPVYLFPDLTLKLNPDLEIISSVSKAISVDNVRRFMINIPIKAALLLFLILVSIVMVISIVAMNTKNLNMQKLIKTRIL